MPDIPLPNTDAPPAQGERPAQSDRIAADASPVNLQLLEPLYAGDPAFQKELVEMFISHSQATLEKIQNALRERDANALRQGAHSLKGAAGGMCAEPLCVAAAALEIAARQGRVDPGMPALVEALQAQLSRTTEYLHATLARAL